MDKQSEQIKERSVLFNTLVQSGPLTIRVDLLRDGRMIISDDKGNTYTCEEIRGRS